MLFGRSSFLAFALLTSLVIPTACSEDPRVDVVDVQTGGSDDGGAGGAESMVEAGGVAGIGGTTDAGGSSAGADAGSGGDISQAGGAGGSSGSSEPGTAGSGGGGACNVEVTQEVLAPGTHVALCSEVTYATNPPSSGSHYPTWADFGVYDFPLPRGFWVHNLEHGAVVVSYNCPTDCAAEVAAASAWLYQLSPDASCPTGAPRVLLVPDPELDVRWAASSWGFTLRADCFDDAAFSDFYVAHAGQSPAPEAAVCSAGPDLRVPNAEVCGANP
ncbi:MAG TPA: DUF3105 domain-containing protein [Polyangiaceae bacterium]|nr:DUF3105 domain-containing protein [Polyangiaceae bacterium]